MLPPSKYNPVSVTDYQSFKVASVRPTRFADTTMNLIHLINHPGMNLMTQVSPPSPDLSLERSSSIILSKYRRTRQDTFKNNNSAA